MPFISQIDLAKRLVLTTVFGTVKDEDLASYVTRAMEGLERPRYDELVQARGTLTVHVTAAGLQRIAETVARFSATGAHQRVAVVVRRNEAADLVKVLQALGSDAFAEVRAVASNEQALDWLRPDVP